MEQQVQRVEVKNFEEFLKSYQAGVPVYADIGTRRCRVMGRVGDRLGVEVRPRAYVWVAITAHTFYTQQPVPAAGPQV